ncbi:protein of unknown function [Candidatus Nitrosocosmicus franklandus]|uniref:Uncharacterized protein n=1 Tax=Candidatus Nitrosocosmicus franklandianus TaxID=1798806 RepID=A0A484IEE8_9ARCH|nr:protein of unknown function [Candidatus Nitrosocosmicus franklandus]
MTLVLRPIGLELKRFLTIGYIKKALVKNNTFSSHNHLYQIDQSYSITGNLEPKDPKKITRFKSSNFYKIYFS